jgi:hypothetical protein
MILTPMEPSADTSATFTVLREISQHAVHQIIIQDGLCSGMALPQNLRVAPDPIMYVM